MIAKGCFFVALLIILSAFIVPLEALFREDRRALSPYKVRVRRDDTDTGASTPETVANPPESPPPETAGTSPPLDTSTVLPKPPSEATTNTSAAAQPGIPPQPVAPVRPVSTTPAVVKPCQCNSQVYCWNCVILLAEEVCSSLADWMSWDYFELGDWDIRTKPLLKKPGKVPKKIKPPSGRLLEVSLRDEENAFLESTHNFYMNLRKGFAEKNPDVPLSSDLKTVYQLPDELTLIAADVLGVPAKTVVEQFEQMNNKEAAKRLWQVLNDRQQTGGGDAGKTLSGINPTSISYFLKEFLATFNGVSTAVSELASIVFQNQTITPPQKN